MAPPSLPGRTESRLLTKAAFAFSWGTSRFPRCGGGAPYALPPRSGAERPLSRGLLWEPLGSRLLRGQSPLRASLQGRARSALSRGGFHGEPLGSRLLRGQSPLRASLQGRARSALSRGGFFGNLSVPGCCGGKAPFAPPSKVGRGAPSLASLRLAPVRVGGGGCSRFPFEDERLIRFGAVLGWGSCCGVGVAWVGLVGVHGRYAADSGEQR